MKETILNGLEIHKLNREQFNSIQELEEYAMYLVEDDEVSQIVVQDEEPQNPEENAIWIDTSSENPTMKIRKNEQWIDLSVTGGAVKYLPQDLTSAQASQARNNIGVFTQSTQPTTANEGDIWFDTSKSFMDTIYPVGSIYTTSTNSSPVNTLGVGTWELIDKEFKSIRGNNTTSFTASTNMTNSGTYFIRGGHSIRIRQAIKVGTALSDSAATLGTLNWESLGFTDVNIGYYYGSAFSDDANGGFIYNIAWDTGIITQNDILDSPSTSGYTFYLDFTTVIPFEKMIDSFCDKFYWKRTA